MISVTEFSQNSYLVASKSGDEINSLCPRRMTMSVAVIVGGNFRAISTV